MSVADQGAATAPQNRLLDDVYVGNLPRRVAHAVHALLAASGPYAHGIGILTAREVCEYDGPEAYTPKHTAAALREAQKLGLVAYVPPNLWTPTNRVRHLQLALETRFLRETDDV